jgi:hypothetical protein
LAYSSYIDAVDVADESIVAIDDNDAARSGIANSTLSIPADAAVVEDCVDETYDSISPISENLANADEINSEISFTSQTVRHEAMKIATDIAGRSSSDQVGDNELDQEQTKQPTGRKDISREGSVRRGKWSLGSKIGTGSFGVVHVGMNTHTGQLMAVKSVELLRLP